MTTKLELLKAKQEFWLKLLGILIPALVTVFTLLYQNTGWKPTESGIKTKTHREIRKISVNGKEMFTLQQVVTGSKE